MDATASKRTNGLQPVGDADLLAACTRRDQKAFATLVERHFDIVHRVIWRHMNGHAEAEDIAQEAFMKLWKDPAQVRDAGALRGWLIRVATNLAADRFRRKEMVALPEEDVLIDDRDNAERAMGRREVAALVDAAVARLPERQRLALTLVHFEGLGQREAASILDVSIDALESLLGRARRSMKEHLAPQRQELLAGLASDGG